MFAFLDRSLRPTLLNLGSRRNIPGDWSPGFGRLRRQQHLWSPLSLHINSRDSQPLLSSAETAPVLDAGILSRP